MKTPPPRGWDTNILTHLAVGERALPRLQNGRNGRHRRYELTADLAERKTILVFLSFKLLALSWPAISQRSTRARSQKTNQRFFCKLLQESQ
jgi:hypothetical protein